MSLPYLEPLISARAGRAHVPEPPRRGEPGGEPCGDLQRRDDDRALVRRALHAPRAGRGSLPGRRVAGQPRARRLVRRPARRSCRAFGPLAARVERAILGARRRRARAPLPLGRRRRALPRLVHSAPARHARGLGDDAAALGGRAAERPDEELADAAQPGRRSDVTMSTPARAPARHRRRRRHRARLDDRRRRVRGVRARGRGGRRSGCWSGWRSRPASPTATRSRPRSSRPSTRPRAAPTSTAGSGSASGGASSPAGAS